MAGAIAALSGSALVAVEMQQGGASMDYALNCVQNFANRHIAYLNAPIVGIALTHSGHGCWLLGADGGVFAFGDAHFHGSTAGLGLLSPMVAIEPTKHGHGYWLVAADGGVFNFGDAGYYGSAGGSVRAHPIVSMDVTSSGHGYTLTDSQGRVYVFGDALVAIPGSSSGSAAKPVTPGEAARHAVRKVETKANRKAARKAGRKATHVRRHVRL